MNSPVWLPVRRDPARVRRGVVAAIMAVVVVVALQPMPAAAAADGYRPPAIKPIPAVPVTPVAAKDVAARAMPDATRKPAPRWPAPAAAEVSVERGATARAGALPVRVGAPTAAGAVVRVEVLDRATTQRAGVRGLLLRLARTDTAATARADAAASATASMALTVDYRDFATAYGGDWASRLRLVALPACALTTPSRRDCAGTPLKSTNDVRARTVAGRVPVSAAGALVALAAGSSGPAGDLAATSLQPSSTWSAGGNSGAFNWSYPMRVPPAVGGPSPALALSYSSQSVDGRHAASNNQPSWVGEGFEANPGGSIERRYRGCATDMDGSANNDEKTGDLCWETDNATLSLSGHSGELIYNATEGRWHLRSDDGSRIERKTGATNGDNNGEHWVVTTPDGTQYWFGLGRLPGWASGDPVTNSTWTVPVFGNDPGEPCHATAFADSDCVQAYRWNLDHVVDVHGNTASYWYSKETNRYGRNLDQDDAAAYDRGGWLDRIAYGTRRDGGVESVLDAPPPAQVVFGVADRCLSGCSTHDEAHWPDVPWDSDCAAAPCDFSSPTFWSTKRLSTVTTQVRSGGSYANAERWTLTHTFPDPGDGTRAGLWLSRLSHQGLSGGTTGLPDIQFTGVQLSNRVDTIDFAAAMNWWRIAMIRNESGGTVSVTYSAPDCVAGQTPTPHTNTKRCYPVRWTPEGYEDPVTDWFHKYVVTTIFENDNTGGVPPQGSPRTMYRYSYLDGAAWHYSDDDGLIDPEDKTWSVYRGYARVGVTVGDDGDSPTYTETRYFRGMHGDRAAPAGGTRTVTVTGTGVPSVNDEETYAGMTRESIVFNGPGGAVVSRSISEPWRSGATATRTINGDTVTARYTGVAASHNRTTLDGGRPDRVSSARNTFDSYGMVTQVEDLGDAAVSGDENCTKTDYEPRNTSIWMIGKPQRVRAYAVACAATSGSLTEAQVVGETRTSYDNQAFGTAPVRGLPTRTEQMAGWNAGAPTFTTVARAAYDVHGRVITEWDPMDRPTTTAYTPATGGPVTGATVTNTMGHVTATTVNPAFGSPVSTVDPNGKRTDLAYDGLNRLTGVWLPGRDKATQSATMTYAYLVRNDAATVVSTAKLNGSAQYVTSYALFDGMLRARQTQAPSTSGGRLLTESFYDSAGRQVRTFGSYHATGSPGTTLVTSTERTSVPNQSRIVFDGAGRPTASIFQPYDAQRWRTTTAYGGDRVDVTPPTGGTAMSTVSDVRGRTVAVRQYREPVTTPNTPGSWDQTTYTYNPKGRLVAVRDPAGNTWTYAYDLRGRQTEMVDPDKGRVTSTFDNSDRVTSTTDARGQKLFYLYDALGRKRALYQDVLGGTPRAQWVYDTIAKGQISQTTRVVGGALYQVKVLGYTDRYQPTGAQIVIPSAETGLAGTYDLHNTYNTVDGSLVSTSLPAATGDLPTETLTYNYDGLGMPTSLTSVYGSPGTSLSYVAGTAYNALGQLDQLTLDTDNAAGGRVWLAYTRELETGRLTGVRTDRDSATPNRISDVRFSYDHAGNVLKIADVAPDPVDDTQCFGYDYLRRLTEAWTPASGDCTAARTVSALGGPAPYWHSWTFDTASVGNRKTQTVHTAAGDATTTYTYPAAGAAQPHAVTALTGAQTAQYRYDAAGNTTCRPAGAAANVCPGGAASQTLTWDSEGNLATSTDSTGTTTYIYDADGNRLVRRDPTGSTLFLPGQELRYSAGSLTCTRFYTFAGVTVASRTSAGLTWLASDHQGTALTSINQVTQQSTTRRQTPYGTPRGSNPAWPNSRGFVGGTQDNTGLTHLGAREYDPATGRFISVDPAMDLADPQQWNGYAYASNSPITRSDPTGLRPDEGNGGPAAPSCDYANAYARYYCQSATRGYVSVTLTPAQSFKIFADSYCECDIRDVINAPDDYMKKASLQNVVVQWLCAQAMGITCEEYDDRAHPDMSLTGLLLELTGIQDVIDCTNGNWAGCAWTAVNLASLVLPAAKLAAAGKAARVADVAGDLAEARRMSGNLTPADVDEALECLVAAMSFAAGTAVLMADGSTKPIEEVKPGDRVLATDPETGRTEGKVVTQVWVHDDTLLDLRLDGAGTLTTTEDHPFWNETDRQWQPAQRLDRGDQLRTPTGARVAAVRLDWNTAHTGRAYNLTVDGLHTYYVVAGLRAVLVHNCGRTDLGDGLFQYPDGSIRRSDGTFAGTTGGRVGAEAEKAVWDNLEQQGHKVIRAPVAVRGNGQLRIFDGAIDIGNGKLIGIEVKSGGASLSSAQRNFDTWLNTSGSTAATVGNYAGYDVVGVNMWNVP